jgi:metal-responsive CopG/Arc/MetJ family transcriptional regulator
LASIRITLDSRLLAQVTAIARDRRLGRDQLIEIALRNLLTLHDWPATRNGRRSPGRAAFNRVATNRPKEEEPPSDNAQVDPLNPPSDSTE